jgi:hypothetical protein
MTANAQWWVHYTDKSGRTGMLSLASPDLADPRKARQRAAGEARARLARKGVTVKITGVRCVG